MVAVDIHIICMPDRDPEKAIESCRHPDVRLWIAESTGSNIGAQRAALIAQGSAPLVGYCDDDDEWLPGGLEALMSGWDGSSNGIYGDEENFFEDGSIVVRGGPWSVRNFLIGKGGPHNGILYNRAILTNHLSTLAEMNTGEGVYLRRALAPYQYVNQSVYRWNRHPAQISRTCPDHSEWVRRSKELTKGHMHELLMKER